MTEITAAVARLVPLLALLLLVFVLRRLERLLPSRRWRRVIQRGLIPPIELIAAVGVVAWLFGTLVDGRADSTVLAWTLVFLALAWTARTPIEDFVTGALLRMEGGVEPGRVVDAAGGAGRVARLGYRALELEADDGATLRLPWRTVARSPLRLGEGAVTARAHSFTLTVPRTRPIERILEEIPAAALVSPWASTRRPPEVRLRAETDQAYVLEVTTHAIDARFAPQIETDILERMLAQGPGRWSNPGAAGGDAA